MGGSGVSGAVRSNFGIKNSAKNGHDVSGKKQEQTDRIAISGLFLYSFQVCKPRLSVKTQTVRAFLRFYGAFDRTRRVRRDTVCL